jgi:hypothetical protein
MPLVRLEQGGFYRFGSHKGFRPVHVFVGRIDEPGEFANRVGQPVVSTIVMSMREGMPRVGLAPFFLSALFLDPVEPILPVDLQGSDFDENYREWRAAYEAGDADIWDIGPAEVYNKAIHNLLESRKHLRRPS